MVTVCDLFLLYIYIFMSFHGETARNSGAGSLRFTLKSLVPQFLAVLVPQHE